jgi:hypothetical protein
MMPKEKTVEDQTTVVPENKQPSDIRVRKDFSETFLWESFDVKTIELVLNYK